MESLWQSSYTVGPDLAGIRLSSHAERKSLVMLLPLIHHAYPSNPSPMLLVSNSNFVGVSQRSICGKELFIHLYPGKSTQWHPTCHILQNPPTLIWKPDPHTDDPRGLIHRSLCSSWDQAHFQLLTVLVLISPKYTTHNMFSTGLLSHIKTIFFLSIQNPGFFSVSFLTMN